MLPFAKFLLLNHCYACQKFNVYVAFEFDDSQIGRQPTFSATELGNALLCMMASHKSGRDSVYNCCVVCGIYT